MLFNEYTLFLELENNFSKRDFDKKREKGIKFFYYMGFGFKIFEVGFFYFRYGLVIV